ncbi:MAG: S-layer homology domain-containing protein [Eubacteriales bacterium]|nr:S-layer homology domain-containing protein [Eubacteriales bacterium]MDY4212588.1 S-layer homology domain-containing protein [Eubacteriales bacterium]
MRKSLIFVLVILMALCGGGVTYAQSDSESGKTENLLFVNDGYIELSGTMKFADENSFVVLSVVGGKNSDGSAMPDGGNVVYVSEKNASAKGEWNFDFALENSGLYTAYVGSKALNENEVTEFYFINKAKFDAVSAALNSADTAAEISEVLKNSAADLGVPIENINDADAVAALLKTELGNSAPEPKEMQRLLKTCCMIADLNGGKISTLKEYAEVLCKNGAACANYLTDTVLSDACGKLSKKGFDGSEKFYNKAEDVIIVSAINNGSADTVKNILSDYKTKLGANGVSISDKLVEAMTKQSFSNVADVKNFIANYTESGSGGNSSSSGSGGSGGSGGTGSSFGSKNTYIGKEAELPNTSDEDSKTIYPFDDIADISWAADAITQLSYRGVLNGKSERLFTPNDNVTREEFAKIITVAFKLNLVNTECPFGDVDENNWAYPYIRSAYKAGIIKGVSDTEFGYGQNITREDLCVMINRMLTVGELTLPQVDGGVFGDDGEISDYAKESVYYLERAGIILGDGTNFNPKASATRAEAAKIVYLALVNTNR